MASVSLAATPQSTAQVTPASRLPLRPWMLLIPLMLLVCWLAMRTYDRTGITPDELASIQAAGGALSSNYLFRAWDYLRTFDPVHPPGYFILLNLWSNALGWSGFAMKLFSLAWGLLGVAFTYRLALDLSRRNQVVALSAAAILAISPVFVHYLHEIRMYTMIAALTAYVFWQYHDIMTRARRPGIVRYVALCIGATLLMYAQYFGAIPLLVLGLTHLTFVRRIDRRWWGVVLAMIVAGLLYVPWLDVTLNIASVYNAGERANISWYPALMMQNVLFLFGSGFGWLVVITAAFAWRGQGVRTAWFWLVAIFLMTFAVNEIIKAAAAIRYIIYLWPLLALVMGYGIASAARLHRLIGAGLFACWAAAALYTSANRTFEGAILSDDIRYPFHVVAPALEGPLQQGDALAFSMPFIPYENLMNYYFGPLALSAPVQFVTPASTAADIDALNASLTSTARLWLGYRPGQSLEAIGFAGALDADFALCTRDDLRGGLLTLDLLARDPVCCTGAMDAGTPLIRFGEDIQLMHVDPLPESVTGTLPVLLRLAAADTVPLHSVSFSLQATDSAGSKTAQTDHELFLGANCYAVAVPLTDVPPGPYTLNLVVYNWQTGAQYSGNDLGTGDWNVAMPIGTFEVTAAP